MGTFISSCRPPGSAGLREYAAGRPLPEAGVLASLIVLRFWKSIIARS
ncbi:hypothetical protein HMPREF3213_00065 [Heyndrickxia coagulans]|uniref:Uncharacterized protein n=1 Tax=Heyndrickxia coagulans TaxID=1398 RepID=A0A133L3M6_HEYCO|nr:hypothetical protein HMPREF3213_00065 [Heyndrickxia coagulans]